MATRAHTTPARQRAERRARLEAAIEAAIAALDALDGDPDLEPDPVEPSQQPWSLDRALYQAPRPMPGLNPG